MGDDFPSIFSRLFRYIDSDVVLEAIRLANDLMYRTYIQDCSVGYVPYKSKLHVNSSGNMKQYNHHIRSQLKQKRRNRDDNSISILR